MKKKLIVLMLAGALCFLLAGCKQLLTFLNLDDFVVAIEQIEQAPYVESRAEVSMDYAGIQAERTIFFQLSREKDVRAYMEYEEEEESFLLYYYDGVFYLNEDGYKTIMPFDFTSMEILSLYNYVDAELLANVVDSFQIEKQGESSVLEVEVNTQAVKPLIDQMLSAVSFTAFPDTVSFRTVCEDGKIDFLDVSLQGIAEQMPYQIDVRLTYSFEESRPFPQIDVNQFRYGSGRRTFYPMKLYQQAKAEASLTDEEYLALPQVWEMGQTEGDEAFFGQATNDLVSLYRKKGGKTEMVLQESVDIVDGLVNTFTYSNIMIDGEYVRLLGKNHSLYRLQRESWELEQIDRGEYDYFVCVGDWHIAFGGLGAYAISKDGTERYSLNVFDGINAEFASLLGSDRGYVYLSLHSNSESSSAVMRVGVQDGELVFQRVRLPLNEAQSPHLFAINHGVLYYSYSLIQTEEDFWEHVYLFDTGETFIHETIPGFIRHLYNRNNYIINDGAKAISVDWNGEGYRVQWVDLRTRETEDLLLLADFFEYGRVCQDRLELVTSKGIFCLNKDGSQTRFIF